MQLVDPLKVAPVCRMNQHNVQNCTDGLQRCRCLLIPQLSTLRSRATCRCSRVISRSSVLSTQPAILHADAKSCYSALNFQQQLRAQPPVIHVPPRAAVASPRSDCSLFPIMIPTSSSLLPLRCRCLLLLRPLSAEAHAVGVHRDRPVAGVQVRCLVVKGRQVVRHHLRSIGSSTALADTAVLT